MGRPRKELALKCRKGIWYAVIYDDAGRAREVSTGERDEKAATAVALSWKQAAVDSDRDAKEATINDALSALISDREAKVRAGEVTQHTVEFYRKHAGLLVGFFGHDFLISRWTKDSRESWRYIEWRRQVPVLDSTIAKELGTLRAALYVAKEQGLFRGDAELAVPATLARGSGVSERSPTREEVLSVLPHLSPDAAAITTYILATTAEFAALERASRADVIPRTTPPRVHVRGSKTGTRDRQVPIATDEQTALFDYAMKHAQGEGDQLFSSLANYRRALGNACELARVEHIHPHSLRHAAGQWLVDQSVPIEVVSKILGHTTTATTERIYARVKSEQLGDRILDAIDPAYARNVKRPKKAARLVQTITKLPEPKANVLYLVGKEGRTLTEWAQASGISKTTLHHRLAKGLTMQQAIDLGRGTRGRALSSSGGFQESETLPKLSRNGGQNRSLSAQNRTPESEKPLKIRAQGRNRTADTGIFNPLLYQLSYLGPLRFPVTGTRNIFVWALIVKHDGSRPHFSSAGRATRAGASGAFVVAAGLVRLELIRCCAVGQGHSRCRVAAGRDDARPRRRPPREHVDERVDLARFGARDAKRDALARVELGVALEGVELAEGAVVDLPDLALDPRRRWRCAVAQREQGRVGPEVDERAWLERRRFAEESASEPLEHVVVGASTHQGAVDEDQGHDARTIPR